MTDKLHLYLYVSAVICENIVNGVDLAALRRPDTYTYIVK